MEIEKIYVDMDRVLVDFDRGLLELCNFTPINQDTCAKEQDDQLHLAMKEVPHFYGKLKPIEEGLDMFRIIYEKYGNKCEILSGIPTPDWGILHTKSDKEEWVKKYMGPEIIVHAVYRKEKGNYCKGSKYLLIDDSTRNINAWTAAGGTGILHTSQGQTIEILRKLGVL